MTSFRYNDPISRTVNTSIIALTILVIAYFVTQVLSTHFNQYLKIKAVDDCAKISRYDKEEKDGAHFTYPVMDIYKNCLKDKDIR